MLFIQDCPVRLLIQYRYLKNGLLLFTYKDFCHVLIHYSYWNYLHVLAKEGLVLVLL